MGPRIISGYGAALASGVQGVLLINTEAIFTALLAFVFFGRN